MPDSGQMVKIDWARSKDDPRATIVVRKYHEMSLEFLRRFRDPKVHQRYTGEANAQRLLAIQTPVLLGAIKAHENSDWLIVGKAETPQQLKTIYKADWGYIASAIEALCAVGAIVFGLKNTGEHYQIAPSSAFEGDIRAARATANSLDYSRPFDVHTWSDHPEVNTLVDEVYAEFFETRGNARIRKRHLKVLLLDLYMAWTQDPDLKIALQRGHDAYRARTRYNRLHISSMTPTIADRLIEVGLLHQHRGFNDKENKSPGKVSRVWPTKALQQMFKDARFGPLDIGDHSERECIVLRDIDKESGESKDIDYEETVATEVMREKLTSYTNRR